MAVLASAVDSVIDLLSQFVIWLADWAMARSGGGERVCCCCALLLLTWHWVGVCWPGAVAAASTAWPGFVPPMRWQEGRSIPSRQSAAGAHLSAGLRIHHGEGRSGMQQLNSGASTEFVVDSLLERCKAIGASGKWGSPTNEETVCLRLTSRPLSLYPCCCAAGDWLAAGHPGVG